MKKAYQIKVNNTDIRLRPSSIDSFYSCPYKWGKTFLEGVNHRTNSRAAAGTAIHASVEQLWIESMQKKERTVNMSSAIDAAMLAWKEETKEGVAFDDGENEGTIAVEIVKGTEAFIEDIMPFSAIPIAVEQYFEVPLEHKLVSSIGGTIDYLAPKVIADLKTSKRKISTGKYVTQQSIYKYLAEKNGIEVEHNLIQGVVLKQKPDGEILTLEPDVELAKARVNHILDVLELIATDKVAPEMVLHGNPGDPLCSPKYCGLYCNGCPYVRGDK